MEEQGCLVAAEDLRPSLRMGGCSPFEEVRCTSYLCGADLEGCEPEFIHDYERQIE